MAYHACIQSGLRCKPHRTVSNQASRRLIQRTSVICASSDNLHHASRRSLLTFLVGLGATTASGVLADPPPPTQGEPLPAVAFPVSTPAPAPQPNDPTIFTYDFVSDVPCNLRVREYWTIINQTRPRIWQQIAQQIQTGKYDILSIDLNLAPMADLRHAALHLPWALLQNYDYTAASDSMKAYKNLDEHIKDLQRAALAAAALSPTEVPPQQAQQVQQAFILMSASLDGYLATVPSRYTASLSLFGKGNGNGAPAPAPAPVPAPAPAGTPPTIGQAAANTGLNPSASSLAPE